MSKKDSKSPLEIPETVSKDLKTFIEESVRIVNDGFTELIKEVKEFDKRHAENRRRIQNGTRRRTGGRIV